VKQIALAFEDQAVTLRYPETLQADIGALFADAKQAKRRPSALIEIQEDRTQGRFVLQPNGGKTTSGLDKETCLSVLLGEIVHTLVNDLNSGVALHAGAVTWRDHGVLLPGASGAGKSSLVAWLTGKGCGYLTDELTVLHSDVPNFSAFARPLVVKNGAGFSAAELETIAGGNAVRHGANLICLPKTGSADQTTQCRLAVFPRFEQGSRLRIEPLSAAQAGLELTACNVNARNLSDHGFATITAFARSVPAVMLHYGKFNQLEGVLDTLLELAVEGPLGPAEFRRLFAAVAPPDMVVEEPAAKSTPQPATIAEVPEPTPRREPKKLTIGMATYDDYDGAFFTLQSLRMYHPEAMDDVELVVVDNNPQGPCAKPLKALEGQIPNYRYIPFQERVSTTTREVVFEEASGDYVVCMDCHVFVVPGAIKRLLDYFDENSETNDLLQGPLVYDDLTSFSTHFKPDWRQGMWGFWETDERGKDPDAEPFEIPMQGLGLFACRREAWLGFNPNFRGFGGEEGYIHEKFRQSGARTLCLPFLRWLHRFNRPMGVPYSNTWDDRIRNYLIGFDELGLELQPVVDHFTELLGAKHANPIFEHALADLEQIRAKKQN